MSSCMLASEAAPFKDLQHSLWRKAIKALTYHRLACAHFYMTKKTNVSTIVVRGEGSTRWCVWRQSWIYCFFGAIAVVNGRGRLRPGGKWL